MLSKEKDFDMIATLQTVPAAKGIYAINNTGSSFVNNSRDIAPFECYVICKQGSTDAPDSFDLPAKLPTAIDNETVTGSKSTPPTGIWLSSRMNPPK